jgi:hypothetical protein
MGYLNIYELIGYVASVLVAISLTMTSILRLRIINLTGSACFTLYGLLIGAYPVAIVNSHHRLYQHLLPLRRVCDAGVFQAAGRFPAVRVPAILFEIL